MKSSGGGASPLFVILAPALCAESIENSRPARAELVRDDKFFYALDLGMLSAKKPITPEASRPAREHLRNRR